MKLKRFKTDDDIELEIRESGFDDFDAVINPEFDSTYDILSFAYELGQLKKNCYIFEIDDMVCFMLGNKKAILKRIKTSKHN